MVVVRSDGAYPRRERRGIAPVPRIRIDGLEADYELANDLTPETEGYDGIASESANSGAGFEPLGDSTTPFSGEFDGSGYTISGVTIDRGDEPYVGLFGFVGTEGRITELTISDVSITGEGVGGPTGPGVGAVAGTNEGTIEHSSASGEVITTRNLGGGLVGNNHDGTVSASNADVDVTGNPPSGGIGGLVGTNTGDSVIETSSATGTVSGETDTGGLVGFNGGDVRESYATGAVSGEFGTGGLIGYNTDSGVGVDTEETTGNGTVEDCYALGAVDGGDYVGGLVGTERGARTIRRCYAVGPVSADGERDRIGDPLTEGELTTHGLTRSTHSEEQTPIVGGLIGELSGVVEGSYFDTERTGQADGAYAYQGSEINGLPTAEMQGVTPTKK